MPDKFDPYREALVLEHDTIWPEEYAESLTPEEKRRVEEALHGDPASCSNIEYVRLHTGFCRRITVTPEDIARISG